MAPLLEVYQLYKTYQYRPVVNGLSFVIYPGEVVGLLGPNGSGKTTTFYLTMGLIKPDKGRVIFKGEEITSLPLHQRAHLGMGYLAQEPSVFRSLSVEDNISCVLETLPLTHHQRNLRLRELLRELHLEGLAKKKAGYLSGGERRRLEITRALVNNPSLLLLDEPFSGIDPLAITELKKMISILKSKNISILITDHNAREIFSIVDRSYLIQDGHVLISGTSQELIKNPEAKNVYFGEEFVL